MPNTNRDWKGNLVPKYFNTYYDTKDRAYRNQYSKLRGKVPAKYLINDRGVYRNVVDRVFEIAKEDLLYKRDGVVLDNLAYMCVWATPEPKIYRNPKDGKIHTNLFADGRFYTLGFFTWVFRGNKLRGWYMEEAFTARVGKAMYNQLKKGFRYGMQLQLVKAIFGGAKNYSRKIKERFVE